MSTGTVILLILVLVVVAVVAALASVAVHRRPGHGTGDERRIGAQFGRLVRAAGPRGARSESARRRRRVDKLGLQPLSEEQRAGYERQWTAAQERFIDSPPQSAAAGAALVTAVAAERGYDVSDADQLLVDLSVYHEPYLDGYRRARQTTARAEAAATEELRQALLEHRALFDDLLSRSSGAAARGKKTRPAGGWRQATPVPNRVTRRQDGDRVAAARP